MPIQIRLMGLRMSAFANEGLRVNHSITNVRECNLYAMLFLIFTQNIVSFESAA